MRGRVLPALMTHFARAKPSGNLLKSSSPTPVLTSLRPAAFKPALSWRVSFRFETGGRRGVAADLARTAKGLCLTIWDWGDNASAERRLEEAVQCARDGGGLW